eukprot:6741532-Pyramimonas_sp.AAC.1
MGQALHMPVKISDRIDESLPIEEHSAYLLLRRLVQCGWEWSPLPKKPKGREAIRGREVNHPQNPPPTEGCGCGSRNRERGGSGGREGGRDSVHSVPGAVRARL